jgi:hypothetical protein
MMKVGILELEILALFQKYTPNSTEYRAKSLEGKHWPEEDERSLRSNAILLSNALLVIDIHFGECYRVFL